jgi:hypothetical protein
MSGTIIDSLIVQLGLDSKPMDNAAPKAVRGLESIEKQGDKASDSVGELSKAMAGFLTLIGGTVAIKAFISDAITATAEIGRLSKNIDLSVESITEWGSASERMGGSAQALRGTMQMLSRAQTEFQLTGNSGLLPYFTMLRVNFDALQSQNPEQQLESLADGFSRLEQARGRAFANNVGLSMGIDQGTMNLLLMGRKELEIYLKRQKEYADQVAKFAPAAAKFQDQLTGLKQKFTVLGYTLLNEASPAIEKFVTFLEKMGDWVSNNKQFVVDFLKVLAVGIGAVALAALPIEATTIAVVALAAGFALLWDDYQTWAKGGKSAFNWGDFAAGLGVVKDTVVELIKDLKEAYAWWEKWMNRGHENDKNWMGIPGQGKGKTTTDPVTKQKTPASTGAPSTKAAALGARLSPADIERYFIAQGWTPEQAAGIAANLMAESSGKNNLVGDHGTAYGLAQWHPSRQADFRAQYGHDIQHSTSAEQLAFIQYELTKGNYKGVGDSLKGTKTAQAAGDLISRQYERPKDTAGEAMRRGNAAAMLMGMPGASSVAANASSAAPGQMASGMDQSVKTTIGSITVNTQATDAYGMADDMNHSMDYLFTGQANRGLF